MPKGEKGAAAEIVIPGGGECRRGEGLNDLAERENAVQGPDHAELDLHFAARDGAAGGLVAAILTQKIINGSSASGYGGKALHVADDHAREVGLRSQGAEDSRDGGWATSAGLVAPAERTAHRAFLYRT